MPSEAVTKRMKAHLAAWSNCERCPLHKAAANYVLYRGTVPAQVLFIGEAPGYAEDATGKPFVGQSGKLLDKIIFESMPGNRQASKDRHYTYTYCISNVVACIPWKWDRNARIDDLYEVRPPTKEEAKACSPRLLELLDICQPKAIVTLGKSAAKFVPSSPEKYQRCELVHPAFLLRQTDMQLDLKRCILKLSAFISKVL